MIFSILDRLVRRLIRRSIRLGVVEGSLLWIVVGAGALVLRLLFRPEAPKVHRERLALGETLVVTHRPPPPQRERRARRTATP